MNQYNLIYPLEGKIYYSESSKNAAKKALSDLFKSNKYDQTRLILENNNTKEKFNFIGIKNNRLQEYKKLLESKNPIQIGGDDEINDKEFYSKLSELSGNLNITIGELSKILKTKYDPESDHKNEVILLIKDGITKLEEMNNNIGNINENINEIKGKLIDTNSDSEKSVDLDLKNNLEIQNIKSKKSGFCTIM
jgi:predicted DNA-binding ArsR family transcriptional regulator